MLGEKSLFQNMGKQSLLNVVMKIIINKYIIHVFKKDNQYDIPLQF